MKALVYIFDFNFLSILLKILGSGSILCAPRNPFSTVTLEQITDICNSVKKYFEFIIIDTGAGISDAVMELVVASSEVIVVATPEPTSITDAYSLLKTLQKIQ